MQSLWIGEELGVLQQLSIRSFLANSCEYHLYTYGSVRGVPDGVSTRDANAVVPRTDVFIQPPGFGEGSYSGFSDVFRYYLLHEHGGWWVDTDVVCLQALPETSPYVFATEKSSAGSTTTASCVVRTPPRAEFLRYCLEVCLGVDRSRFRWGQIGPELLDDAIWRFGLEGYRAPVHHFNPVNYYDFHEFTEPGFDFHRLIGSYSVHLWHQMWKTTGTDPAAVWSVDSLIGMLKARYLEPGHS